MGGEVPLRDRLQNARGRARPEPGDRPLILGPTPTDVFPTGARDEVERSHAIVHALRRASDAVIALQRRIVDAGADLVVAPTSATTAPALHATGQAYRAAALTAAAVDLSREAVLASSSTAVSVIGEVPTSASTRARSEAQVHVERLATSAIDGILIYADDAPSCREVVRSASMHRLASIVEVELAHRAMLQEYGHDDLPSMVLLRGEDAGVLSEALEELQMVLPGVPLGARVIVHSTESAQILAARTLHVLASLGLACISVGGPRAIEVLTALADLSSIPRTTIDPPPHPSA